MKIAILGSRGIPNKYGGFEQFAEYISVGLKDKGYSVTVYNPSFHEYQDNSFKGVSIVHKWCPEDKLGSAAHFIYDYICLKDALQKDFDIILELGYQSVAISYLLLPIKKSIVVTNMDGLEWKRDKWSPVVKKITKWFEKKGAQKSNYLVSDNTGIKEYLEETYKKESEMIPYGAEIFTNPTNLTLNQYNVKKYSYCVLIARLEPENNVETILDGYIKGQLDEKFLVIGNNNTKYGEMLKRKYANSKIEFIGGVYDIDILNNIRYFAKVYFHGHSVGGTNPSLLEAMASHAFIIAHNNIFNKSVLEDDAYYFSTSDDITKLINNYDEIEKNRKTKIKNNIEKITTRYSWNTIVTQYEKLFKRLLNENSNNYTK